MQTLKYKSSAAGFTLMEALVALGIFTIGFVAVAALFPAAAILQNQTISEVRAQQFSDNVRAMVKSHKFIKDDLLDTPAPDIVDGNVDIGQRVHRFNYTAAGYADWTLRDRSYPVRTTDPLLNDFYWVPLVRDADTQADSHEWQVFIFVLRREPGASYSQTEIGDPAGADTANPNDFDDKGTPAPGDDTFPVPKVRRLTGFTAAQGSTTITNIPNASNIFKIGDWLLDNNGVVYRVTAVTPPSTIGINSFITASPNPVTELWYADPGTGGRSPARRIIVLTGDDAVKEIITP